MDRKRSTYLIQDPYDLDAIEFILAIELNYGLRPICFYTDPKSRHYGEQRLPVLRSDLVEATYDVSLDDLESFVAMVRDDYDVIAVVPYREDTIEVAAELSGLLGLEWNDPATLLRFRDKFAQRTYLREVAPDIRVPFGMLITSAAELRQATLPDRFVVKPNDGLGNMSIGIFDRDEIDKAVCHVDSNHTTEWIVEEFIGGIEYHVDGQVRPDGSIDVLAVVEYMRVVVNDYPTVYLAEIQCRTDEYPFQELASYAVELLTATGLRACPFHLEAKVDDAGPCLIDLGARLPSEGGGRSLTRAHPERPSAYAVAAHDYLGRTDALDLPVRWDHYDLARSVYVYGLSEETVRIASVHGVDEVEAMPEFARWAVKPEIGTMIRETRDLRGAPWIVEMELNGTRAEAISLAEEVRSTIGWNRDAGATARTTAGVRDVVARGRRKMRWNVQRLLAALPPGSFRS